MVNIEKEPHHDIYLTDIYIQYNQALTEAKLFNAIGFPGINQERPGANADKLRMDVPEDSEFSSPVEVKIELDEEGTSIPFCTFAWGKRSDYQPGIANEKNELYSEEEIKQEPSMDISSCCSATNLTYPDTDNQTYNQRGLCQPVGLGQASINENIAGSKTTSKIPEVTTCQGTELPSCAQCPELKFVSETHLLAHNIDKHGFQVPSDLEKTNKNQISGLELSVNCSGIESSDPNFATGSNQGSVGHLKSHSENNWFQCTMCDYRFRQKTNLTNHIRTHTGEKPFHCTMCDYKCRKKINLTHHIRTHTGEKPFQCTMCNFKCSQKSNLTIHTRFHTGEKPFHCTMCDFKSSRKQYVTNHIRDHSGEKPFECTMCNYKSSLKLNLANHIRTHTTGKPFHCTMCNYKCNSKHNLTRHVRTHTGEKPFHCTMCDYKCKQKANLTIHTRNHTGEKPFHCTMCDYKCKAKLDLTRHIRTHTGEKPFQCTICDYKCRQKRDLMKHVRTHTGEENVHKV